MSQKDPGTPKVGEDLLRIHFSAGLVSALFLLFLTISGRCCRYPNESQHEDPMGLTMVYVQGGVLNMGDPFGDGDPDEKPVHSVTLDGFWILRFEVKQSFYRKIMEKNPSHFIGDDDLPVENISWNDAVEFCNVLSQWEGLTPCYTIQENSIACDFEADGYRLPTEAEWEYAARGGNRSLGYRYSGGDSALGVMWYDYNSQDRTHPVGRKHPNELGIFDMSGNVWEWCWDWYGSYSSEAEKNPTGPSTGTYHVLRGGSWFNGEWYCRSTLRSGNVPDFRYAFIGFRYVRSLK